MNAAKQDLKELLLQSDQEFHELADKHHELEDRLNQLSAKHYLSAPEQLEEVNLKKRKLQIKDRMEDIIRRHQHTQAPVSMASHAEIRAQIRS
ncbi:MAG: YdcH family protein [Betaproteobacteria bacterium]